MADHLSTPRCPSSDVNLDEALRHVRAQQANHPFPPPLQAQVAARIDTPTLLRQIADRLEGYAPTDPMREEARLAQALTWAVRRHGYTKRAYEAELLVLRAAPRVALGITRAEYALLLRQAAGR